MPLKTITFSILLSATISLFAVNYMQNRQAQTSNPASTNLPVQYARYVEEFQKQGGVNESMNFVPAANISTPCVVHIKTTYTVRTQMSNPFGMFDDDFFRFFGNPRQQQQQQQSSGSGVIVSEDGYIVTNNHVIQDATDIEVILNNKKTFKATLVGTDKDTDLGLIKINAKDLQSINFANSDEVNVGEWVLAVGNPFNLASTVTAGIVSAKGRSINLLNNQVGRNNNTSIESFIQTDAAVNPGNSGGALVNIKGQLIGINTAIASPTGTYAGYSFAVPSNLVKKVIEDLKNYGLVQRGYLGVNMVGVNDEIAKKMNLSSLDGVYVDNVINGGSAEAAGLKAKDIILKINGVAVNSAPELQEQIATARPGEKVEIEYMRDQKILQTKAILKNQAGTTSIIKNDPESQPMKVGLELMALNVNEARSLNLQGGLRVMKVKEGLIRNYTDLKEGFIITSIRDKAVKTVEEFNRELASVGKGTVIIEGIYPNRPFTYQYAFKI